MSEVLQANIFFFVTSIAVIVFTLLLCVALYHVIRVIKSIRRIVDRIEEGSEAIAADMAHIRKYFAEGSLISHVLGLVLGGRENTTAQPKKRSRSKKRASKRGKTTLTITDEDS